MRVRQELLNGLLLLGRSHPKGKVSGEDNRVTFYTNVEDLGVLSKADEKLLEDYGWIYIEDKEIDVWVYW